MTRREVMRRLAAASVGAMIPASISASSKLVHELRKGVHAGASYRKQQRPLFLFLSDEKPTLRLHDLHRA